MTWRSRTIELAELDESYDQAAFGVGFAAADLQHVLFDFGVRRLLPQVGERLLELGLVDCAIIGEGQLMSYRVS